MLKVSVIVPVYKGTNYITNMIRQIEACRNKACCEVELLFVNDYPDEELEQQDSKVIDVIVLNTDINRGIHGARVEGLKHATGELVWFLDQDDRVNDEFLREQIFLLLSKDADVAVCGATREGKRVYDSNVSLSAAVRFDFMLEHGNFIVSPGQAIIKKEKIPSVWKKNILKINGVDDWFLWLCMLYEKCEFATNDRILYEHVDDGGNASFNTCRMFQSENEMLDIIIKKHLFNDDTVEKISNCISRMQYNQLSLLDKFRRLFLVYDAWMMLNSKGKTIAGYLKECGYRKIGIYGVGYIGKQLVAELEGSDIEIVYCIDRNADFIISNHHVLTEIDLAKEVDLYIVTVLDDAGNICDSIQGNTGTCAKSFVELLEEIGR